MELYFPVTALEFISGKLTIPSKNGFLSKIVPCDKVFLMEYLKSGFPTSYEKYGYVVINKTQFSNLGILEDIPGAAVVSLPIKLSLKKSVFQQIKWN